MEDNEERLKNFHDRITVLEKEIYENRGVNITIGDISISGNNLQKCEELLGKIISTKKLCNYLYYNKKKKDVKAGFYG